MYIFNVSESVVRITDMLKYECWDFCATKISKEIGKKWQIFVSSSVKLQERVMCSPVIFLSSNFIVQYEECNLFSSEHNTELLWQVEVYTITGNTNREGVAPWPVG